MEVNFLKSNELSYEIRIRKVNPPDTVELKRKVLRGLLYKEKTVGNLVSLENPFTPSEDCQGITDSLNDLKLVIENFTGDKNDTDFKRIASRLSHINGRFERLALDDTVTCDMRSSLQCSILEMEGEYADKLDTFVSQNKVDSGKMRPGSLSESEHSIDSQHLSQLSLEEVHDPLTSKPFHFPNYVAPYKWNVHFSGSPNESVNSFLEKINLLREARGVSKQELFASACDLFQDQAWNWYLSIRSRVKNWDDLELKLREDFLPYFYDEDLWQEIHSRTQGSNERVAIYISVMEGLFSRLSVLPEECIMVNTIRRNLLPDYISCLALQDIDSVVRLKTLCKRLEESRNWSCRYKPPSSKRSGFLEPDLSCYNNVFNAGGSRPFPKIKSANVSIVSPSVSVPTCWNCGCSGHVYNKCLDPRRIFCYGCGMKDVVKSKCPNCSKNEVTGCEQPELAPSTSRPDKKPISRNPSVPPNQQRNPHHH